MTLKKNRNFLLQFRAELPSYSISIIVQEILPYTVERTAELCYRKFLFSFSAICYSYNLAFLKQLTASLVGIMEGFSSVKQPNPSFNNYKKEC